MSVRFRLRLLDVFAVLDRLVVSFVRPALVALSVFIAAAIFTGVVSRSVFEAPLFGVEELVLIAVMWLYMLGAVLASRDSSHLSADFLPSLIDNPRVLSAVELFAHLISLAMCLAFVIWSWQLFSWSLHWQQATPVFAWPWFVSQSSPFVCSVLMSLYVLRDCLAHGLGLAEENS